MGDNDGAAHLSRRPYGPPRGEGECVSTTDGLTLMELRHLRYFVAVAHEGHITRAAEKLHMQQPPLSQQIKALEEEIEAALFIRHPRGVSLTDAGRSFLVDAEAILAQAEHAKIRARRTARGEVGRIAVGFTTSA